MKIHQLLITLFIVALVTFSCAKKQQDLEHHHGDTSTTAVQVDTVKKSIPKEEHAQVGNTHVMIKYHAPAVRGRTIWGGLVPYGEVWVTGAHSATALEIDRPVIIADKEVPAGKYALFTIPGKESWTIIVNKNWDQHLADKYDQQDDVLRLDVKPEQLQDVQERLKYSIVPSGDSGASIDIRWEKVKVSLPFKVK